jgi:SAM-dependent methyltransferase
MSKNQNNNIMSLIDGKHVDQLNDLYNKITSTSEFEIIFFGQPDKSLSYEKYISLMKFLSKRYGNQKNKIKSENNLDVTYRTEEKTFRLSINGLDDINYIVEPFHKYENHVTLKTLALKTKDKNNVAISLMKKVKEKENLVDIPDLNMRIRLSEELPVSNTEFDSLQKLNNQDAKNITFRLKQRVSFFVLGDYESDTYIRIDMTITKMSNVLNRLNSAIPNYELEMELISKDGKVPKDKSLLNTMFSESEIIMKVIEKSNFILTEKTKDYVLQSYAKLFGIKYEDMTSLDSRPSVSLEIQHVTEILPNKYAVTDKADGDRYFLIILDNHVYLISTNLAVKDTGIILDKEMSSYNNTVIDGEYIFIPSKNRHIFMAFDCLFKGGKDVRKTQELMVRLAFADEVIEKCFTNKKHKGFTFKEYQSSDKEFNLEKIVNFHAAQVKEFVDNLNHDIELDKKYPLIRRKYFIPVTGAVPWEIFAYSSMLWRKHTSDKGVQTPYQLDGLIYQALNQDYNTSMKESKLIDFKWKPQDKNSIDFYITFEKDRITGKVLTVYDNSIDEYIRNKPYKICNLHVGRKGKYGEEPTLFREQDNGYSAHLFLKEGEAVDSEGNLLTDKTVVEFYYDNNPELDERFRWVPIRTRYDKTEQVQKYKKKYGNFYDVAMKVWRSIVNPVLITDFDDLARGNDEKTGKYFYDNKLENLRKKIGHELILTATREDQYFQVRTNLAKSMRQYHNWVKSVLLYTHCLPAYQNDKKLSVLDFACGKGQDLMKFYYCNVAYYVGIDIDKTALTSAIDGAMSRYNQLRKTHDAFPKMDFIQGDLGAIMDYENQYKALGGMNKENKDLIEKYFPSDPNKKHLFDRINCQFALHYFLKSKETWENFKENLRNHLKPSGYFIVSASDGNAINKLLKDKDKHTVYYTTEKGEKKVLFEMIKKYPKVDEGKLIGLGNPVDVFMAWLFQEGNYMTEYLVDKDFIVKELLEDCDLELVDTDLYSNMMVMHKDFFMNYIQYEENPETNKFFHNVKEYYIENSVNKGCYEQTKLFRYFVFRKRDVPSSIKSKPKEKKESKEQKGGKFNLFDDRQFIIESPNASGNSYCDAIYNVLRTHKLIPKTYATDNLFKDFNLPVKHDNDLDEDYMKKVCTKLNISHQLKGLDGSTVTKQVIDGINIFVVEKDCNGELDIDIIEKQKKTNKKTKALVFYKDGSNYTPVYQIHEETKKKGIFNMSETLIQDLIELYKNN